MFVLKLNKLFAKQHKKCMPERKVYNPLIVSRYTTQAKMVDNGTGTLYIIGSFKRMTTDPDFKVSHIFRYARKYRVIFQRYALIRA